MSCSRTPKPPSPMYLSRPHSVSAEHLILHTRHSKNVPIFAVLGSTQVRRGRFLRGRI